MSIAGIICEYNPFHNGHEYLIKEAKKRGYSVVAVMSGNYTQRGELAIADKYTRAITAIKGGADLVLELPFPFCMSSAEFFAKGGISVLERIGADGIFFGSESGDMGFIRSAAEAVSSPEFAAMKNQIAKEEGAAKGYFGALGMMLGENVKMLSNDILAVEYLKEIKRRGLDIIATGVKRVGDAYRDEKISSEFASATAIRKFLLEASTEGLDKYIPSKVVDVLEKSINNGEMPVDAKRLEAAVLTFWRMVNPASLSEIAELGNGLEYRIKDAALSSATLEEFILNASTKKYTSAKIRRAVLFGLLGVTKADLDAEPGYTTVLAANKTGREILSSVRKNEGNLKIVTKAADAPECRQYEISSRADSLYTLAMPSPQNSGYLTKKKIYIE